MEDTLTLEEKEEIINLEKEAESKGYILIKSTQESYSGPLPSPETLQKYEDIEKGLADRIVRMAEKQSEHRQECEKTILNLENREIDIKSRGQLLGTIITVLLAFMGIFLIFIGKEISGFIALLSVIAKMVFEIYFGKKYQDEQIKEYKSKKEDY